MNSLNNWKINALVTSNSKICCNSKQGYLIQTTPYPPGSLTQIKSTTQKITNIRLVSSGSATNPWCYKNLASTWDPDLSLDSKWIKMNRVDEVYLHQGMLSQEDCNRAVYSTRPPSSLSAVKPPVSSGILYHQNRF